MPLVLVHGIGAEDDRHFHWEEFLEFAESRPELRDKYKIYLFRYDSNRSVPEVSLALRDTLKAFIRVENAERPVRILAYSEGGLLTRNALQDPWLNEHTEQVITIATPFHGSPLANPGWMERQAKKDPVLSPVRASMGVAYWMTRKRYPSFEADFGWDNFDQSLSAQEAAGRSQRIGYSLASKTNFITYGSYFGVEGSAEQVLPQALGLADPLPKERVKLAHLFTKSVMFTLVRDNMAKLPLAPIAQAVKKIKPGRAPESNELLQGAVAMSALAEARPMTAYNDGISPISSTLWLGRFTPSFEQVANPAEKVWAALASLKGTRVARLFKGIDHRDWMEGRNRTDSKVVTDLLNPDQAPKTVFEWLLYDLTAADTVAEG